MCRISTPTAELHPQASMMKQFHNTFDGRRFSHVQDDCFVQLNDESSSDDFLKHLVAKSWQGLKNGFSPTLCEAGVGGTYFMRDEHNRNIAVFKPQDEEMGCMNNPKGFTPKADGFQDDSARRGVYVGEAAFRECAAFLLDHDHFSGVPATDLVVCNHPCFSWSPDAAGRADSPGSMKFGSFQEFKEHDFDAEDVSPSKYSRFPVHEVHKVAILDVRLFNTDRHGGNILVKELQVSSPRLSRHNSSSDCSDDSDMQFKMEMESDLDSDCSLGDSGDSLRRSSDDDCDGDVSFELIPIDHGYTLPHTFEGLNDLWFEWLNWPQARCPFDKETLDYIARLDPDKDIAILRDKFQDWIQPDCYRVLKIATMWLKIGAANGLTAYDIGYMMCRKIPDQPSELEKMCSKAMELAQLESMWFTELNKDDIFFEKLAVIMEHTALERKEEGTKSLQNRFSLKYKPAK